MNSFLLKSNRPISQHLALKIVGFGLAIILCACATDDIQTQMSDTPSQPMYNIMPLIVTIESQGSCTESPFLLEDWLGRTLAGRENMVINLESALASTDTDVTRELENLILLRNGLSLAHVPDCAIQTHNHLLNLTEDTIQLIQAHISGQENIKLLKARIDEGVQNLEAHIDSLLGTLDDLTSA